MFKINIILIFLIIIINNFNKISAIDLITSLSKLENNDLSNEIIDDSYLMNKFVFKKPIDPEIVEDSILQVPQLIEKYGRPAEIHKVETDDGYILEMHRMARPGAKPVLLMHGLLDSSSTWVLMGPDKGFAYMLWDLGYDVWMGNARGNHYSRNHRTLDPNRSKFWQFSFHEIGIYDVPNMIDYVLNETSSEKLQYIGHSQGTITFWIMCSERPEYCDKIISMNALAPVAFLDYIRSPLIKVITFLIKNFSHMISLIGPNEFFAK